MSGHDMFKQENEYSGFTFSFTIIEPLAFTISELNVCRGATLMTQQYCIWELYFSSKYGQPKYADLLMKPIVNWQIWLLQFESRMMPDSEVSSTLFSILNDNPAFSFKSSQILLDQY